MSKSKNGRLDQYGAKPFEQQQFQAAGVESVKRTIGHTLLPSCMWDQQHLHHLSSVSCIWQPSTTKTFRSLPLVYGTLWSSTSPLHLQYWPSGNSWLTAHLFSNYFHWLHVACLRSENIYHLRWLQWRRQGCMSLRLSPPKMSHSPHRPQRKTDWLRLKGYFNPEIYTT